MVNSYIVDDNGLPMLDKSYQKKAPLTKIEGTTPVTDLTVYTDPRIDFSRTFLILLIWIILFRRLWTVGFVDISNGGPYLNKKNIPKRLIEEYEFEYDLLFFCKELPPDPLCRRLLWYLRLWLNRRSCRLSSVCQYGSCHAANFLYEGCCRTVWCQRNIRYRDDRKCFFIRIGW